MIDGHGRVRITDFGLAVAESADSASRPDAFEAEVSGTPAYMAPEQLAGRRSSEGSAY